MLARLKHVAVSLAVSSVIVAVFLGVVGLMAAFHAHSAGKTYEYNIHGAIDIDGAEKFRVFMKDKRKADSINIHIESPGGLVVSMHKYIYHLKKTKARVVCTVDSHAASAAAMILLACKNVLVAPEAMVLFHLSRYCIKPGLMGCQKYKVVNPIDEPADYRRAIRFLKVAKRYLTKEEWSSMIKGKDIRIRGEVLMRRIRNGGVRYVYRTQ